MTHRFSIHCLALVTLSVAFAGGCASDDTADDSAELDNSAQAPSRSLDELPEVAAIAFSNGGSIRFLEPEPGALLEVEKSPPNDARVRLEGEDTLSPAEKYTAISGKPAPARLVELSASFADLNADAALESATPVADVRSGASEKAFVANNKTYDQFWAAYCQSGSGLWRRDLWNVPTRHKTSKATYYRVGIMSLIGTTRVDYLLWGNWNNVNVDAGWTFGFTYMDGPLGHDTETKATPTGNGSTFSHCVSARN